MKRIDKRWILHPVKVTWLDHVGHGSSWVDLKDLDDKAATFVTYGWLLRVWPDRIVIGSTLDEDKTTTGDVTVLVRSCITDIEKINI